MARTAACVNAMSSRRLGRLEVLQLGDVPVGQHHEVAGVVRVQVEHRVHGVAAGHDEPVLVGHARDAAERAARRAPASLM